MILTRIGDSYRQMGDLVTAKDYYQKALNIEYDSYAVLGLALINKEKGNYPEAIETLTRAARMGVKPLGLAETLEKIQKMG